MTDQGCGAALAGSGSAGTLGRNPSQALAAAAASHGRRATGASWAVVRVLDRAAGARRHRLEVDVADWIDADRTISLRLADGSRVLQPLPRRIEIRVAGETTTREASFDGTPMLIRV